MSRGLVVCVVVGEGHQDHVDQRRHCEDQDAQQGQAQKQPDDVGVEEAGHVVQNAVDLSSGQLALAGVLAGINGGHPHHDGHGGDNDSHHAVEQHQHGVVALLDHIDAQALIESHTLLMGSQRSHVGQTGKPVGNHIVDIREFQRQIHGAFDDLSPYHVGQAPHQIGQLGKNVTIHKDGDGCSPDR